MLFQYFSRVPVYMQIVLFITPHRTRSVIVAVVAAALFCGLVGLGCYLAESRRWRKPRTLAYSSLALAGIDRRSGRWTANSRLGLARSTRLILSNLVRTTPPARIHRGHCAENLAKWIAKPKQTIQSQTSWLASRK